MIQQTEITGTKKTMESPTDFSDRLGNVLEAIGKPIWADILIKIVDRYDGVDNSYIEEEIIEMLWTIKSAHTHDNEISTQSLIALRLPRLSCFRIRVCTFISNDYQYWNSLETPFLEFLQDHTIVEVTGSPYPTNDMLKRWVTINFK